MCRLLQTAKGGWLKDFIEFCHGNTVPLDFVSTHGYPSRSSSLVKDIQTAKSQVSGWPLLYVIGFEKRAHFTHN